MVLGAHLTQTTFLGSSPQSPIQPSLGRWEGAGPEQRVGLCRTPAGLRPRPCDLRPRPRSLSLRPLPVICPADPGATRVSQGHSWKAGSSGATHASLSRFAGDWNLCPGGEKPHVRNWRWKRYLAPLRRPHKVPRHPGLPGEEHRGFPAPLPLSPFDPPDLDRKVDSPAWSGRGSRSSGRTSG